MKKKNILRVIILIVAVSLCLFLKNDVQAMTGEEAGKYVAEFAINFFDAHAAETEYGASGRASAYHGEKTSGKYKFDCVGWLSFAVHQATGYGNQDFTEFAVPFHAGSNNSPNPYPGYNNGYKEVYGSGGSNNKIPLDELKSQLKPGDLVMSIGPRKHVLLYVGDNTLIHCDGHGPGAEYGGDNGYGITKESLDHYYKEWGIESIGRLSDSAAASINESNCTTIFGETGKGLTGVWEKASQGGSGTSSSSSSSSNTSNVSGKFTVEGMNEDLNLGLRYPKDNSNTPLNSFIDFTSPFLQTWMIPLAMNAGTLNTTGEESKVKNPHFSYLTIREAMSDITVDRYDITKCTLKTKYKVYDTITYSVSKDKNGDIVKTEISRTTTDESSNGPMAETFVSKKFDVSTKYCIKDAKTFDVKMTNTYTYEKYKDEDVEKRINPMQVNKNENAGSFSEGGDPGRTTYPYTYTVKQGHYVEVTRMWEDKFDKGDCNVETYTTDDVKNYIEKGGMKKPVSKTSTAGYTQTGNIYNCKGYELTEDQITKLAGLAVGEAGEDADELSAVISHMANLYEFKIWSKAWKDKGLFNCIYRRHSAGGWYADKSFNASPTDTAKQLVKSILIEGKRTLPPYVDEFDSYSEMISSKGDILLLDGKQASNYAEAKAMVEAAVPGVTKVRGAHGGSGVFGAAKLSKDGVNGNIFYCSNPEYVKICESQYTQTGDGSKSTTTSSVNSLDNFLFLGDSLTYGLKESKALSEAQFIGVIGSSAAHWNQWLDGTKSKWNQNIDFSSKKMPEESAIKGVCIMLGFNALDGGGSADSAMNDMKKFLDKICAKYPNVPIYVEKVLPCRAGSQVTNASATNESIKKYNDQLSSYCSSKGILFIDTSNGYVGSDGQLASDKSQDGVHLKEYKTLADNIKSAITSSTVTNNSESVKVNTEGLEYFTFSDSQYYSLYESSKEINRVDMMNARPENYLQYLKRGAQYSNHVGYSRAYLAFSYDELKRLFNDRFQGTIPYVYGQSLGFTSTYDNEKRVMDAGTVSGEISGSSGIISADSSMGALEKDPSKKNVLIIAGHNSAAREKPGTYKYTEPTQNRKMAMAFAGALEAAGLNPVIANRVMAHNKGKGDYKDSYGVIWGDEDVYENLSSSEAKAMFQGYDYIVEFHHNATDSAPGSVSGTLLTYPSSYTVSEIDKKFLQIFVDNNLGNKKQGDVVQGLRNMSVAKELNIPMTYLECEYYDNEKAMDYIDANYNKIAGEMAMVLREHFGVTTPMNTSSSGSNSNGTSSGGSYEWDSGGLQTFDYNNLPGEEVNFELSFYCAIDNAMEGGSLGTHDNPLVFGNVASNYWSNGNKVWGRKIYLNGVGLFTVEDTGRSIRF